MYVRTYISVSELSSHGEASGQVGAERKIGAGEAEKGEGGGVNFSPEMRPFLS